MKALRDWNLEDTQQYLNTKGIHAPVRDLKKAGEGNMNCTMRVIHDQGSLILKQSSPFCEKFPEVKAPIGRINEEVRFYHLASSNKNLTKFIPHNIFFDEKNYLFAMEDLGEGKDFLSVYGADKIEENDLKQIARILSEIHATDISGSEFTNFEMRELNHAHMYDIPFQENNGLNLDDISNGFTKLAKNYIHSSKILKASKEIGELYLKKGDTLLHGDYYPGSWMKCDDKIFTIDPEFGFIGPKEFDLGVSLGHLHLSDHSQSEIETYLSSYSHPYDENLMSAFAGLEIFRRILGYAQLPMNKDLARLESKLQLAESLI